MCGIAGYLHFEKARNASADVLQRMTNSLVHRGPDGEGMFTQEQVAFGHRRLAIIDVASGQQPMKSQDGLNVITFNGEIYNYLELRAELFSYGHRFITNSDTEVLLAAYKQWGTSCVHKLNGMWAFAIWDYNKQELFCSRDRLGEKPFFYAEYDNTFVFGSEIKALFAYGIPKEVNSETLDAYLCFTYIPAPYTYFKNIHKLLPGHNLIVKSNGISISEYWDLPLNHTDILRTDTDRVKEEFSYLFDNSVQLRMRCDVPFGAFLSGGLDSASVVQAMTRHSNHAVKTFTIGFENQQYDERHLAKLVAQQYNSIHTENVVVPEDAEQMLAVLAYHYDEPFGDSSALPTYIVSKMAREHVTMVLTGDGGDEVLSGYTIHQGEKFARQFRKVPSIVRSFVIPTMLHGAKAVSPQSVSKKLDRIRTLIHSSNSDFVSRLMSKQTGFMQTERDILLEQSQNVRPAIEFVQERLSKVRHLDSFSQLNYWLTKVSLPDDMLTKVDRATMANSLEARVPFLDYRLVELMAGVSMDVKLKGYTRKHVLRSTLGKQLPQELLKAKKRGFVVPLRDWMRSGSADALERRALYVTDSGLIKRETVAEITLHHKTGLKDRANALWTLAMLSNTM